MTMLIQRRDPFTGKHNVMALPITFEDYQRWERGEGLIQDIFPSLSPDQREFLMTGIMPDSWDAFLGTEDEAPQAVSLLKGKA